MVSNGENWKKIHVSYVTFRSDTLRLQTDVPWGKTDQLYFMYLDVIGDWTGNVRHYANLKDTCPLNIWCQFLKLIASWNIPCKLHVLNWKLLWAAMRMIQTNMSQVACIVTRDGCLYLGVNSCHINVHHRKLFEWKGLWNDSSPL